MSYYTSIEFLPLTIWEKCQAGELELLRLEPEKGTPEEDQEVWQALNYQYMEEFGIDRMQQKYAQLRKSLISKELELIETGNRIILNEIRRIKNEISSLFSEQRQSEGMSIDDSLVYLSKFMGFFLQKSQLMTKQYFTLLKQYGKANK